MSDNTLNDIVEVVSGPLRDLVHSLITPLQQRVAALEHEGEILRLRKRIAELEGRGFTEASER